MTLDAKQWRYDRNRWLDIELFWADIVVSVCGAINSAALLLRSANNVEVPGLSPVISNEQHDSGPVDEHPPKFEKHLRGVG